MKFEFSVLKLVVFFVSFLLLVGVVLLVDPERVYEVFLVGIPGMWFIFPVMFAIVFAVSKILRLENLIGILLSTWIVVVFVLRAYGFDDVLYPAILLVLMLMIWLAAGEAKGRRSRRREKKKT